MQTRGKGHWAPVVVLVGAAVLLSTAASAMEVQLAGIRLDAPWVTVLDVYGNPDGVVLGGQPPAAAAGGGGGAMPAAGGMGGPMGALAGAVGTYAGALNAAMGEGGMPGGMPGMGMPGMGGMPMMGGGAGGLGGAGGPAAGGGGGSGTFPMWALPVWVEMEPNEVEWLYRKGEVVIGFVFNPDGYVRVVAVAGEMCDYARTALWRPHRYVRLGDDFKRVLYRYGYPDQVETFIGDTGAGAGAGAAPGGGGAGPGGGGMPGAGPGGPGGPPGGMPGMPGGGAGPGAAAAPGGGAGGGAAAIGAINVTFNGTTNSYSRDCVVTYRDKNNIAFTLHNMKVTRIHIWKVEGG
jgi:hypothetical protein